jgi:hypothetical protein
MYRWIWEDKRKKGTLYQYLRRKGKKYNKRGNSLAGRETRVQNFFLFVFKKIVIIFVLDKVTMKL